VVSQDRALKERTCCAVSERRYVIKQDFLPPSKLKFKILAPSFAEVPSTFVRTTIDRAEHAKMMSDVQRLRGDVYREYGPIAARLSSDGRHRQSIDPVSWHILMEDENGKIAACSRYRDIQNGFDQLGASSSALAFSQKYGGLLRMAVEDQISHAHRCKIQYGEAGAWALRPEIRCSSAAINSVLMTFALAEQLGGGLGITTATTRHHSASILRRLGGHSLGGLPAYYDPAYGCVIEIIHFNSALLNRQYMARVEKLKAELHGIEVICPITSDCIDSHNFPMQPFRVDPYGAAVSCLVQ